MGDVNANPSLVTRAAQLPALSYPSSAFLIAEESKEQTSRKIMFIKTMHGNFLHVHPYLHLPVTTL